MKTIYFTFIFYQIARSPQRGPQQSYKGETVVMCMACKWHKSQNCIMLFSLPVDGAHQHISRCKLLSLVLKAAKLGLKLPTLLLCS